MGVCAIRWCAAVPYRGGIPICILIYAEDVDRPAYSVRCLCVSVDKVEPVSVNVYTPSDNSDADADECMHHLSPTNNVDARRLLSC